MSLNLYSFYFTRTAPQNFSKITIVKMTFIQYYTKLCPEPLRRLEFSP